MAKPTQKQLNFVLEIWEVEGYFYNENGWAVSFNYQKGHFEKRHAAHYLMPINGLKQIFKQRYNSVCKLNQAMGVQRNKTYWFYNHINEFLKGKHGEWAYSIRSAPKFIFVVRQLHDLDGHYQIS